jgi:type I restriction enzyme S subunit
VKLGEAVEFLDSLRRPVTESERRPGPYPYYGANGQQGTIDDYIFDEPLVLLAEDGGHFDEPEKGIAYRITGKTWVNNHGHILRPNPNVDLAFLYRVLENYDATPFVTGTTRGKLTQAGAAEILIPLPPLPEQRRIADILDLTEELRIKRRAALAQLNTLTEAIFFRLFCFEKRHKLFALCEVASLKRGPFGGALKKEIFVARGYKVYEQKNAIQDDFLIGRYFINESKYRDMEDFAIKAQDLIVSCSGTLGKVAIVPENALPGVINQALLRIRINESRITPLYLKYVLESIEIKNRLTGISHGTGLQNFPPMSEIRALRVEVPPLSLQNEFARRIAAVENLKAAHRASLAKLDELFSSLQRRAFRGEL